MARIMCEVEEVQEQMKADMEAMKDQMAAMMEAMLSMKKIMESNVAVVATTSVATKGDPTHPVSDMVGQWEEALGNTLVDRKKIKNLKGIKRNKDVKGNIKIEVMFAHLIKGCRLLW